MLNRSAVILRPKQPYKDWLRALFPDKDFADTDEEPVVYLIPAFDDNDERLASIEAVFEVLFATELNAWYIDEERWPSKRTLAMFQAWFTVETFGAVEDLSAEDGPVEESEWR